MENATVEWTPMFRAEYLKVHPTADPSAFDWYYIERSELIAEDFFAFVLILALSFIGLYIGSMLKKQQKHKIQNKEIIYTCTLLLFVTVADAYC